MLDHSIPLTGAFNEYARPPARDFAPAGGR